MGSGDQMSFRSIRGAPRGGRLGESAAMRFLPWVARWMTWNQTVGPVQTQELGVRAERSLDETMRKLPVTATLREGPGVLCPPHSGRANHFGQRPRSSAA
jgi:hypothetical protein